MGESSRDSKKEKQQKLKRLEKVFGQLVDTSNIWDELTDASFDMLEATKQLCKKTGIEEKEAREKLKLKASDKEDEEEESDRKKVSRRTSEEVFHRILWDSSYDPKDFVIGYEDRFEGLVETDFETWETKNVTEDNFIPWHRLQYFKQNGVIVWDRRTKLDNVFSNTQHTS